MLWYVLIKVCKYDFFEGDNLSIFRVSFMFEEEVRFCYKLLVFLGEIVFKMVDIILVVFLVWCSFVFLVELF